MNWKFHAIAVTAIMIVIVGIFVATGKINVPAGGKPPAVNPNVPDSDRFIQIAKANWGFNCNRFIEQYNQAVEAQKKIDPYNTQKLVDPVRQNNVLLEISNQCNGKVTCQIAADPKALGDPYRNCRKFLEVEYRCFSFDRPWPVTAEQGTTLTIDCRE